jgi:hypothetical protein
LARGAQPGKISTMRAAITVSKALTLGVMFFGVVSCQKFQDPPIPTYDILIKVESDPTVALPGAVIVRNGKDLATTDKNGQAKLVLNGAEGDNLDFTVRCPSEFNPPLKPVHVTLLRTSRTPEYTTWCSPNVRKVVIAVRAEGGANLPVTYLGRAVAKTDASGAAHVLLAMKPGDQFELGLDTHEYDRLRPQMPTTTFIVKPKDEIQAFDVKFTLEKLKVVYKAGPVRPKRL